MKYIKKIFPLFAISVAVLACKKKGCTDPTASNYDVEAEKENNTCQYKSVVVDSYDVQDSVLGPFATYYYDSYTIEIKTDPSSSAGMTLVNYGNLTNNLTGLPLEVQCQIVGDSIFIPAQLVEGDNVQGNSFDDFEIIASNGHFEMDSIFFYFSHFSSGGDIHSGECWGKKN